MTRFRVGAATEIGRVRAINQDAFLVEESLFAVADGMGGHLGGEVASHLAIEELGRNFDEPDTEVLVTAVQAANDAVVHRSSSDEELRGMGTTLVVMAGVRSGDEDRIAIANVGDSRCYLLGDDGLEQITVDHSVVQTLVDAGRLTKAEAERHPQRNVVTRALGIDARVLADSWELLPVEGDRYLLCSDGLSGEVSDADIADLLRSEPNPAEAAAALVRMANEAGGRDNISVVVVDVLDGAPADVVGRSGSRVLAMVPGEQRVLVDATGVLELAPSDIEAASGDAEEPAPTDAEAGPADAEPVGVVAGGTVDGAPTARNPDPPPNLPVEDVAPIRRRGLSLRTVVFIFVLIAVVLTAIGAVGFAARGTYYVGFDDDQVVIFRGRPGGLLGIDPEVHERFELTRSQVSEGAEDDLDRGKTFPSLDEAQQYVARLEAASDGSTDGTSPDGGSTGSVPSTSDPSADPPEGTEAPAGTDADPAIGPANT